MRKTVKIDLNLKVNLCYSCKLITAQNMKNIKKWIIDKILENIKIWYFIYFFEDLIFFVIVAQN